MQTPRIDHFSRSRYAGLRKTITKATFAIVLLAATAATAGTWTPLLHKTPVINSTNQGNPTLMLLLSDGGVLVENDPTGGGGSSNWFKLTPDIHGSYSSGTWTILAPSTYTRAGCASDVLTNGNIFFAGGEYGTGGPTAELYNPVSNVWTIIPVPVSLLDPSKGQTFSDAISELQPNGKVLVTPYAGATNHETMLYNPATNGFTAGPNVRASQSEASWVKLPDNSILTIDSSSTNSERYIPSLNGWFTDAHVPVPLYSTGSTNPGAAGGELGPAFLLPDGRAFFSGGNSNTAYYTPSGSTLAGTWTVGPSFPIVGTNSQGMPDAPAAMMVTGNILYVTGVANTFNAPIVFFEFNYLSNTFTQVSGPSGVNLNNLAPYYSKLLVLPDGSVLWNFGNPQLYTYKPVGTPVASGIPAISSITENLDGSYHLVGTGLNGISEGAAYGDDAQMASNYPLVRMTNAATGFVYYARTYNWSSTGVMTSNLLVTTEFALPAALPAGTYSLVVVANGIASDPVPFTTPLSAPVISSSSWSGADLMLTCSNGLAGRTYFVLTSEDPTVPVAEWQPISTNYLTTPGSFTVTVSNAMTPGAPQQFYLVQGQ